MSEKVSDVSQYITEKFGANASYVEDLYNRYKSDPSLVDESWQTYFNDLLSGNSSGVPAKTTAASEPPPVTSTPPPTETKKKTETKIREGVEVKPIFGPSKAIVKNMEESLTVPTATSVRRIPVKLLEENRKIINENLFSRALGKVSFTHLIGWAIIRAAQEFPQMNNGFGVIDGKPSRLESESVNLGIAIDIQKKDGSRNLLVPNLKGVNGLTFWGFF